MSIQTKALIALAIVWFAAMAGMHVFWFEPMTGGLRAPDSRPWGYAADDFAAWQAALGADGQAAFLRWHSRFADFVFPWLMMAAVVSGLLMHRHLLRDLFVAERRDAAVVVPAVVEACEFLEVAGDAVLLAHLGGLGDECRVLGEDAEERGVGRVVEGGGVEGDGAVALDAVLSGVAGHVPGARVHAVPPVRARAGRVAARNPVRQAFSLTIAGHPRKPGRLPRDRPRRAPATVAPNDAIR